MWKSPNIRDHVKEYTDFRLGNMINYYRFNARIDSVGEYDYVYTGKYDELIIPDISTDYLVTRLSELVNKADVLKFEPEIDYQSVSLSHIRYNNILLYQIILFLNSVSSNALFTSDNLKKLLLLTQQQLNEFLLDKNKKSPRTLKKIENVTSYEELVTKQEKNSEDPQQNVDDWLNKKITNNVFTDIQKTNLYKLLVKELGKEYVEKLIIALTKYEKRKRV